MCGIFKDCRKAFDEKSNKNKSNQWAGWAIFSKKLFVKTKMVHAATKIILAQKYENNIGSEVEVKRKGGRRVLEEALSW